MHCKETLSSFEMILDQRLANPIYFRDIFNKGGTVDVDVLKGLGNLTVIDMG